MPTYKDELFMEQYERTIGLRTIYITLLRRLEWVFLIFVPIAIGSFAISNLAVTKTFQSSISISNMSTAFTTTTWPIFENYARKVETMNAIVANLEEKAVKFSNGSKITANDITKGIAFTKITTNTNPVTITFSTTDSKVAGSILSEVAKVTINVLAEAKVSNLTNLSAGTPSSPTKTSKENTYFLIGMAAGLVLGFAVPFVWEIIADQVYDAKDITLLGAEGFELKAAK